MGQALPADFEQGHQRRARHRPEKGKRHVQVARRDGLARDLPDAVAAAVASAARIVSPGHSAKNSLRVRAPRPVAAITTP